MTYHAMFSLYIMTGLLALVISVRAYTFTMPMNRSRMRSSFGIEAGQKFVARRPVSFTSR